MDLKRGARVESYIVEDRLGEGGMAVVYRVRHAHRGTLHALKILHGASGVVEERLLIEGRAQAALSHPNIVQVTEVVRVGGLAGLIMDLVRGPSLEKYLIVRSPNLDQVDHLARGVLAGLAAAHRLAVVHRDIKPGNVLIDLAGPVVPRITDFGLAKVLGTEGSQTRTRSGTAMGTPAYMAPEQIRDASRVDHRADLFSTGALLFELIAGRRAFEGADTFEVFERVAYGRCPPLATLRPDTPRRMLEAVEAALVVDRDRRVGSADVLMALWCGSSPRPRGAFSASEIAAVASLTRVDVDVAPSRPPPVAHPTFMADPVDDDPWSRFEPTVSVARSAPRVAAAADLWEDVAPAPAAAPYNDPTASVEVAPSPAPSPHRAPSPSAEPAAVDVVAEEPVAEVSAVSPRDAPARGASLGLVAAGPWVLAALGWAATSGIVGGVGWSLPANPTLPVLGVLFVVAGLVAGFGRAERAALRAGVWVGGVGAGLGVAPVFSPALSRAWADAGDPTAALVAVTFLVASVGGAALAGAAALVGSTVVAGDTGHVPARSVLSATSSAILVGVVVGGVGLAVGGDDGAAGWLARAQPLVATTVAVWVGASAARRARYPGGEGRAWVRRVGAIVVVAAAVGAAITARGGVVGPSLTLATMVAQVLALVWAWRPAHPVARAAAQGWSIDVASALIAGASAAWVAAAYPIGPTAPGASLWGPPAVLVVGMIGAAPAVAQAVLRRRSGG